MLPDQPLDLGPPINLQDGPLPLWRREDLLTIVAEAVHTYFVYTGRDVPRISESQARAAAELVLRRLMAAGVAVSEPRKFQ
jgi:hypothetical protein